MSSPTSSSPLSTSPNGIAFLCQSLGSSSSGLSSSFGALPEFETLSDKEIIDRKIESLARQIKGCNDQLHQIFNTLSVMDNRLATLERKIKESSSEPAFQPTSPVAPRKGLPFSLRKPLFSSSSPAIPSLPSSSLGELPSEGSSSSSSDSPRTERKKNYSDLVTLANDSLNKRNFEHAIQHFLDAEKSLTERMPRESSTFMGRLSKTGQTLKKNLVNIQTSLAKVYFLAAQQYAYETGSEKYDEYLMHASLYAVKAKDANVSLDELVRFQLAVILALQGGDTFLERAEDLVKSPLVSLPSMGPTVKPFEESLAKGLIEFRKMNDKEAFRYVLQALLDGIDHPTTPEYEKIARDYVERTVANLVQGDEEQKQEIEFRLNVWAQRNPHDITAQKLIGKYFSRFQSKN